MGTKTVILIHDYFLTPKFSEVKHFELLMEHSTILTDSDDILSDSHFYAVGTLMLLKGCYFSCVISEQERI